MSDAVIHVSEESFQNDVLDATTPVLVDFWAPWCGPCKMIGPLVDELAQDYNGKVKMAKVNVDDNQGIAAKYGIRGIPTLLLINHGEVVGTKVGASSKSDLSQFIDEHL